jgi:hypothetical protein
VKNRMREICTSGSVRGEGGNILTYSARAVFRNRAYVTFAPVVFESAFDQFAR